MKKYLFRNINNGHCVHYQPFECQESLTQEKVDKYILHTFPIARKLGSHLDHLLEYLDKKNIKFKRYNYVYYKPEEHNEGFFSSLDPLPLDMYSWDIVEGVSGNY